MEKPQLYSTTCSSVINFKIEARFTTDSPNFMNINPNDRSGPRLPLPRWQKLVVLWRTQLKDLSSPVQPNDIGRSIKRGEHDRNSAVLA